MFLVGHLSGGGEGVTSPPSSSPRVDSPETRPLFETPPLPRPPRSAPLPARVSEVTVRDNEKTTAGTVRGIAGISVGEELTEEKLAEATRRLNASGLFKEVVVTPRARPNGTVAVEISVRDKISWVIAPTFSLSSSNIGGGVLYAENNLFGENKKLLIAAQLTSAESGIYIGFLNSNIFNWYPLSLTMEALYKRDRTDEYAPDASEEDPPLERRTTVLSYGGGIGFVLNWFDVVKTAARYRYLRVSNHNPEDNPYGPAFDPGPSRADANLRLSISYDTLRDLGPIQEGGLFELGYEGSSPAWASDYRYSELGATFKRSLRLFQSHNLRLRASAHLGFDTPFHAELVAGGNNLRGFLYREFRGDTRFAGSGEYHFPLFKIDPIAIRGVAFYDTALTYFRDIPPDLVRVDYSGHVVRRYLPDQLGGPKLHDWGNGIGAGIRLYMSNIVLPLLGIDGGYAINSGAFRVYLVVGIGT